MLRTRTLLVVALGVSLVGALAPPAAARSRAAHDPSQRGALVTVVEASTCAAGTTVAERHFGLNNGSRVKIACEPARAIRANRAVGPSITVGFGWYIYVYLNRGDWLYLAGLGYTAASAALCAWLLPTIGGAVACAVAAYIIGTYIVSHTAPPAGYCAEFKFTYIGTFAGYKRVKRSC